jgi:hypothetical protein
LISLDIGLNNIPIDGLWRVLSSQSTVFVLIYDLDWIDTAYVAKRAIGTREKR